MGQVLRLKVGDAFAVRMRDGRFTIARVLRIMREHGEDVAVMAATNWVGNKPPSLPLATRPEILERSEPRGEMRYMLTFISRHNGKPPANFKFIGTIEPDAWEQKRFCNSYSDWSFFEEHDELRVGPDSDSPRDEVRQLETRATLMENSRKERLSSLTLEQLLKEKPFPDWHRLPPPKIKRQVEKLYLDAVTALIDLGPSASLENKGAVFREFIQALNDLEKKTEFIETDEREDILNRVEEMAHAAGIPEVMDLVQAWRRDW